MILQNDIPFEMRVKFLHDNVCEMPSDLGIVKAHDIDGIDIIAGLKDLLFLLKDLYSDTELFRTGNDREDYNALFAGVIFLNAFCYFTNKIESLGEGEARIFNRYVG